jgi:hypothetical protein
MTGTSRPVVLLYNRLFRRMREPSTQDCSGACEFTTDRGRLLEATAVVFHIPTLRGIPLPAKAPRQRWVAWSMESQVHYPALADPRFMSQFDITMTYRRDSTIWCPYFGPGTVAGLLAAPAPKTERSAAVYFQSSRIDRSGRVAYVAEMMKRVKVDSYGKVLHNRDLDVPDTGRDAMLATMARYKFTLVFENCRDTDYVSDKFFDALVAGSVPVYLGAPNVAEFAPADRCFINVDDFAGPADLAAYLNRLNEHDAEYETYLTWKRVGLAPRFRALVASLEGDFGLCRLCDRLTGARDDRRREATSAMVGTPYDVEGDEHRP